jgi:hypothetical protein
MPCYTDQMKINKKYRTVALLLVLVFSVFNIGIPIITATCPMAKMKQGVVCPACDDRTATADRVTTEQNRSCCATSVVAERNTAEFLQSNNATNPLIHFVVVHLFLLPIEMPIDLSFSFTFCSSSPPSRCEDIPIFVSSLLI